jgi:hypothetical protein
MAALYLLTCKRPTDRRGLILNSLKLKTRMKRTLLTSLLVSFFSLALSQSNKEQVDLVQATFGMEKKAMLAEFVKLEGTQGMHFGRCTMSTKASERRSAKSG